jgi:hypothetical protein
MAVLVGLVLLVAAGQHVGLIEESPPPPERCPRPDLSGPDEMIYDGGASPTVSRKDAEWRAYESCLAGPVAQRGTDDDDRCEATKAEYLRLRDGMSYAQVVEIIGCEGEENSRSSIAGITTIMYSWDGNALISSMNAIFQDDRLVNKAQLGLR